MSNKRFLSVWISLAAILLGLTLCCTLIMNYYAPVMDLTFGRGERKIINTPKAKNFDTQYYPQEFSSPLQAALNGMQLNEKISDEGITLLKNNGVLPMDKSSYVTPMGYRFVYPHYGPRVGSAKIDVNSKYNVSAEEALRQELRLNEAAVRAMKAASPLGMVANGYVKDFDESDIYFRPSVIEFDPKIYAGLERSCSGSVGLVFIGRLGGEGILADIAYEPLFDGSKHGVALSDFERRTVRFAKENCDKVVVVINGCNPLEIGELALEGGELEADAILWVGNTGNTGFKSMVSILTGAVNPSGRLPDVFASNYCDSPMFLNYGKNSKYANVQRDEYYFIYDTFVEYEEGIYNGYRYYETAAMENRDFNYGQLGESGAVIREGAVTYPFGYGLSYTEFKQEITGFSDAGGLITLEVEVTNTGSAAGKDAVQIYYGAPYTDFSKAMKMEKSAKVLAGFAKTKLLKPQEKQTLKVAFEKEDMASYCFTRDNGDGTKGCYVLEKGDYSIWLQNNAHTETDVRTVSVAETVYYDGSNPRRSERETQSFQDGPINAGKSTLIADADVKAATNQFDYMTDYMREKTITFSRADFQGTFPEKPTDFTATQAMLEDFLNNKTFDPDTDAHLGDAAGSKVYDCSEVKQKQKNSLTLADMRGLSYDDPLWEDYLDQLDYAAADLKEMLYKSYMQTGGVKAIEKPETIERDGPLGLTVSILNEQEKPVSCTYSSAPILAATFNVSLAYEFGKAVANEALAHGDMKQPVSGWYAPGLNIHRGPFGGRYHEYFSEDPFLSGMFAASIASGSADHGLNVIVKHFAANNQEADRTGLNTWMNEQALREIYLKPYEICIKNSFTKLKYTADENGAHGESVLKAVGGVMSAQNNLGSRYCGANYALTQSVLREEWGFKGFVITDILSGKKSADLFAKMLRSGVDLIMEFHDYTEPSGLKSATGKNLVRIKVKNVCYRAANGNAMQGAAPGGVVRYGLPPWAIVMIGIFSTEIIFVIAMTALSIWRMRKKPNKYYINCNL